MVQGPNGGFGAWMVVEKKSRRSTRTRQNAGKVTSNTKANDSRFDNLQVDDYDEAELLTFADQGHSSGTRGPNKGRKSGSNNLKSGTTFDANTVLNSPSSLKPKSGIVSDKVTSEVQSKQSQGGNQETNTVVRGKVMTLNSGKVAASFWEAFQSAPLAMNQDVSMATLQDPPDDQQLEFRAKPPDLDHTRVYPNGGGLGLCVTSSLEKGNGVIDTPVKETDTDVVPSSLA
ncbi:hypothetical protein K2173_015116 [Erythroxylum novogranatense]|uniref:Uncharacterized protein n=1 Tax=Erythroxylum novogranatense TaxID=1862640 RepID=A0AAV8T2B4_9ROSI|nr:hypothetical protein K2173_015116 [Erythroxylum novogranatense]